MIFGVLGGRNSNPYCHILLITDELEPEAASDCWYSTTFGSANVLSQAYDAYHLRAWNDGKA